MQILQSSIEKGLYILLLLMFVVNIATLVKLSYDDSRKFHILKANQAQIFCVIKAPPTLATAPRVEQIKYINDCINKNQ